MYCRNRHERQVVRPVHRPYFQEKAVWWHSGSFFYVEAACGTSGSTAMWKLWSFVWRAPKPGEYTIRARATDRQGRTQPPTAAWNPGGYLYNAIDQVKIRVQA